MIRHLVREVQTGVVHAFDEENAYFTCGIHSESTTPVTSSFQDDESAITCEDCKVALGLTDQ